DVSLKSDADRIRGGLLTARTLAVFITTTLSTSMAAKQGPIPMAGHQICRQVWLSVFLLIDVLALAGQALLASSYSQGNYEQASLVIHRVIQILKFWILLGQCNSPFFLWKHVYIVMSFGISEIYLHVQFVAGSQPVNALAFVIDGIYYGVSDFGYAAYSMYSEVLTYTDQLQHVRIRYSDLSIASIQVRFIIWRKGEEIPLMWKGFR
ncbi:Protein DETOXIFICATION 44, chloroplastic, partial [Mucuna pruriens]